MQPPPLLEDNSSQASKRNGYITHDKKYICIDACALINSPPTPHPVLSIRYQLPRGICRVSF